MAHTRWRERKISGFARALPVLPSSLDHVHDNLSLERFLKLQRKCGLSSCMPKSCQCVGLGFAACRGCRRIASWPTAEIADAWMLVISVGIHLAHSATLSTFQSMYMVFAPVEAWLK